MAKVIYDAITSVGGFLRKAFGPKDRQFTWQRDGSGLLTQKSDPEGTTVYDYKAGELVSRVEYPGETVRFSYDRVGRLTEVRYVDIGKCHHRC